MRYACPPLTRSQLRDYALSIRKFLQLENGTWLPVVELLERFDIIINDNDFYYEVVEDDYFPVGTHAAYFPEDNCIRVKNCVYVGACNNCGRDRMTIVHEMAHVFLLKVSNIQFNRCFEGEVVRTCCDSEWQAKCLAGEFMMPCHLVKDQSVVEIAQNCGVSLQAAEFQKDRFK